MNIIENERDKVEYYRRISRALRPLRKALMKFIKVVKKINWKELNESLYKVE